MTENTENTEKTERKPQYHKKNLKLELALKTRNQRS